MENECGARDSNMIIFKNFLILQKFLNIYSRYLCCACCIILTSSYQFSFIDIKNIGYLKDQFYIHN